MKKGSGRTIKARKEIKKKVPIKTKRQRKVTGKSKAAAKPKSRRSSSTARIQKASDYFLKSESQKNLLLTFIFDIIQHSIFVLDADWRYLAFNTQHKQNMKKIYGVDIEIGFNAFDPIRNTEDRQKTEESMKRAMKGETFSVITEYGLSNLKRLVFEVFLSPIKNQLGQVIAVSFVSLNITERVNAEQKLVSAENKFTGIFKESPDAIFVEDADGNILDLNEAAASLQGIEIQQLKEMNIRDLVPAKQFNRILNDYRALFNGTIKLVESRIWCPDGNEIPVEISGKKIIYGDKNAFLLHVRDISERKKLELEKEKVEALKSKQKEELLKASMQTQLDERNRIAAEMHDELGAGLSKISVLCEVIKKSKDDPESMSTHLDKILRASEEVQKNMSEIVWAMDPKYDTLENLIAYINYFAAEFLESSSIEYQFQFPQKIPSISLSGKFRRNLFLIVKESLNNALRHSTAKEINIKAGIQNNTFSIAINDNGTGFDVNNIQRFKNGIINMKKRMAEIGGTFSIVSKKGKGTSIMMEVTLPVDER